MTDQEFMSIALEEARQAAQEDEVPVGAVLQYNGEVIARNHNRMIQRKNPIAHAELLTMQEATGKHPHKWLLDSTLYVTLEPCVMCAGAIVLARIQRLVFAASDPKAGGCGSIFDVVRSPKLNHRPGVESGLFAVESSTLLVDFFKKRRGKSHLSLISKTKSH